MKKYLCLILVLLFFTTLQSYAKPIKMIAQTQNDFSSDRINENVTLKIDGDYEFIDGTYVLNGTVLKGKIVSVVEPKRGKRDGYAYMQLTSYESPKKEKVEIDNPNAVVKLSKYKPLDIKEKSIDLGASAAGLVVKNISYPINFVRGAVTAEEGENRIVSGAKMTYEKSFFSYASKGQVLNVPAGEKLTVTFKFDNSDNEDNVEDDE